MRLQPELFKKGCIFNSQTIKVHYFWQHSILFGPGFLPSFTWIFLALSLPRAFLFIYFFGFRMSEVHLSNYKLFFHFYSSAKPSLLFVHQYSITIIFIISILFTFFNKNSNHSLFFFFFEFWGKVVLNTIHMHMIREMTGIPSDAAKPSEEIVPTYTGDRG